MTDAEYLDALRAAALAGDFKAAWFLDRYAAGLVDTPILSPALAPGVPAGQEACPEL